MHTIHIIHWSWILLLLICNCGLALYCFDLDMVSLLVILLNQPSHFQKSIFHVNLPSATLWMNWRFFKELKGHSYNKMFN